MAKKYLSLERLEEYDALIKDVIDSGDSSTLTSAKSYTDTEVAKKANSSHTHDDRYYTESEIDSKLSTINTSITNITGGTTVVKEAEHAESADAATTATSATKATQDGNGKVISSTYETKTDATAKLTEAKTYTDTVASGKADADHNHDEDYDALGAADTALASAKFYTDTKTSSLATTTVVDSKISTHNTSTTAHSDIRNLITALTTKVNNFLDVDDTTTDQLSEVLTLIENNKGTLESLTSNKVNVSDIVDNLTTASTNKVLSANQGVALKALIDALQASVDGKANSSHSHTITATATDDDVVVLIGTNGSNKVTFDAKHAASGVTAGTYKSVTVNKYGHVTAGTNPTTLSGYGITDAYTKSEVDAKTTVDSALSSTSTKPVQNKIVNQAIVTATNAITTNTNSINAHTSRISSLETKVGDGFEEVTSADIQSLFSA